MRPDAATRRRIALVVAAAVVAAFVTQVLLPGSPGGKGTPAAVLFSGLVVGLVHALTAVGLVVVYRTLRVINFAQTAVGAAGAELTFQLVSRTQVPFVVALVSGLVLAGLLGLGFDLLVGRRFQGSSRLTLTVATVATAGLGVITVEAVSRLPFFDAPITPAEALGAESVRRFLPFAGFEFEVGGFPIPFGFAELLAIELALVLLALVGAFLLFTKVGVAVRAMGTNRERTALVGIDPGSISSTVWVVSGVLGGAGVVLFGALTTPGAARGVAPGVLLPALAAAVLARFQSIPLAAVAAVAIGIASSAAVHSFPQDPALVDAGLLAVVVSGLLLQGRVTGRERDTWGDVEAAGGTVRASDERAPGARAGAVSPGMRVARAGLLVLVAGGVVVYPFLVDVAEIRLGGTVAVVGTVALSIVVLTGWAGQVSLGQWAFAALGGACAGALTADTAVPFWLAAPAGACVAAGAAVVLGLTALRIRGLFLAVTTLAFAFATSEVLFDERYFGWLLPQDVDRPTLFFLDFADERSMYFLAVVTLALSALAVRALRRGHVGRVLLASRDNPADLRAAGVDLVAARLVAFGVSGALAGLAGAVFVHQQTGITADAFTAERSVDAFLLTVIGGIGSVPGAISGALAWTSVNHVWESQPLVAFLRPFVALAVLMLLPGGLASLGARLSDGVARLLPDSEETVSARRRSGARAPLAAPSDAAGLAVTTRVATYAVESVVHRDREHSGASPNAPAGRTSESAVGRGAAS